MQVYADKSVFKYFQTSLSFRISYKDTLAQGQELLCRPRGTLSTLVRNQLPEDYIYDQIYETANIIIIQRDRDIKLNRFTSIRGIALLKLTSDTSSDTSSDTAPTLNLLILGNAKASKIITRNSHNIHRGQGYHIIAFLKSLQKPIQLYSIDNTIPYYYQYGWRFYNHPKQKTEREHYKHAVHHLHLSIQTKDPAQIHQALNPFMKFTPWVEEILSDNSLEESRELAKNNGFRMLYDPMRRF